MIELLIAAFAIGFLGSLHCIGMCGGLIGAMTMTRDNTWWPGVISYQIGRITTYVALGLLVGLLGSVVGQSTWIGNAQSILSIIAGSLIILLALHIAGWLPDPFTRLSKGISQASGMSRWIQAAATQDNTGPWYTVGLLNGLLPCGLVYAGLGLSLTSHSAWSGAAAMLAFGLGTVPAMMAAPALLRIMQPSMRSKVLKIGALLLIIIGALTIVRGTALGQHDHQGHAHHASAQQQFDPKSLDPDAFCIIPKEDQPESMRESEM